MRVVLSISAMALGALLGGCGDDAVPPARAPDDAAGVPVAGAPSPSARLVAEARAATSPAMLAHVLSAMEAVGGPEIVAYCLAVGESESAPPELRRRALAVLVRWADRSDPTVRARSAAIWDRVSALPQGPAPVPGVGGAVRGPVGSMSFGPTAVRGGAIANATQVLAGMAADLRRCYDQALHEDARTAGVIELNAYVDAAGAISSVQEAHTGLTPGLVSCVVARFQTAVFAPPQGGPARVTSLIKFEAM